VFEDEGEVKEGESVQWDLLFLLGGEIDSVLAMEMRGLFDDL
jgi:hypothetical protein